MTDTTYINTDPARHAAPPSTPMRPLQVLLEQNALPFPIRISTLLTDAVVLSRSGLSADLLLHDGSIRTAYVGDHAQLIDEPVRWADLLRSAVRVLTDQIAQAIAEREAQAERHRVVLAEIRAYAIRKHRQEDICRDGLDRFLEHFKMDPYQPQMKVTFTITGSYLVNQENEDRARSDAEDYLRPDLSQLDDIVGDSEDYTVDHLNVEPVDSDDDRS